MNTSVEMINDPIEPHWRRRVACYLGGQGLTMLGSSLVQYAIMWHLVLDTVSGTMMTLYVLAAFFPHVFISPLAGVIADRFDRKRIIIVTDCAIALVTLALALIFLRGYQPHWLLLLAAFLRSVGGGIQAPAVSALLPQLTPKDKLMRVGGLNSSMQSLIFILSPALGGIVLSISNIIAAFFVDIVTAAIGVTILALIAVPPHSKALEREKGGYLRDLKQGFIYVKRHRYIQGLLLFYTIFCIFITPVTFLAPVHIARAFGDAVWMLTVQEICYSGGAILGGLLLAVWGGFKNRALTIGLGTLVFGLLTTVLGAAPQLFLFYAVSLGIGLTLPWSNTSVVVLLQERVDGDMLGRVFSLLAVVGAGGAPLGMLILGPLADAAPIPLLFAACGLFLAALGLGFIKNRRHYAPTEEKQCS